MRVPLGAQGLTCPIRHPVANVSQIVALDNATLTERVGRISQAKLDLLFAGIDIVLGRA